MNGRVVVITGASDGIGAAAARELNARGEHIVVIGRNARRTTAIADELDAPFYLADFSHLDQVRELADQLNRDFPHIDVLAHNAGGKFSERQITADGNEATFQVNYLAPFLLTHLVFDNLIRSKARVISTSSIAHRTARLHVDDIQLEKRWSSWRAYANSKLLNILFTRTLHRRYGTSGLTTACFHPGVVGSNFATDGHGVVSWWYQSRIGKRIMVTPEQGADNLVYLAEGQLGKDWISGGYYAGRHQIQPSRAALNDALADRCWRIAYGLTGLH